MSRNRHDGLELGQRLVDANIIGILVWELEGRILQANDAFLAIVGYEREDLAAGRLRWTDLTPPERLERERMPELPRGGPSRPVEKECLRKDGTRVPVLIGAAIFEEAGNRGVAYVLDLTERRRSQDALSRAGAELARVSSETALGALAASIAHEVNQPLAGIITNANTGLRMLSANPPNVAGALETARRTVRDGTRASEVITCLGRAFPKGDFTAEPLDLNEAVREVVALVCDDLRRNRILLRLELGEFPLINGDRMQLRQVVLNLVRNAAQAMAGVRDRPRELLVRTERETSEQVRLTVRDTGVGLPPEGRNPLFGTFYIPNKGAGMGMGLFASRSIVERHRGRLWAQANEGAPGTTFYLLIPYG